MKQNQKSRITRHGFLRGTAAASVLVVGGTVYRAASEGVFSVGQGLAYEPWRTWRTWRTDASEGPIALVRAAILASNPHNSQPWLFRVAEDRVDVFADLARNLGAIDPFRREMYIGLGCAIENLALAASPNGYRADVRLMPDPSNPSHAAHVALSREPINLSPLYEVIPSRHTNRGAYYTSRPVAPATLDALAQLTGDPNVRVFWFVEPPERARVGDLIVEVTIALTEDAQQSEDSHAWFRQRWAEVQAERSGLTIDAQALPPMLTAVVKMLPETPASVADASFIAATRDVHTASAAAFGLLAVRDARDDAQRLSGGRLWQRMHLWATTQGIAMQPLSQLTERADREAQLGIGPRFGDALKALIGDPAWQALMPFRMGYPMQEARPSPRRAVEDVLI